MSLQDAYRRFLADPKSTSLAPDASLIYITTTTRVDQADAVIDHLTRQQRIVKKKSEEILSAVEGPDSLCLDIETTLEFVSGGGAYLPSLDDNFLADRVATFPMLHIVRFNSQKQVQQVKLYWDQASLLKQIEVIGSRGRNWPIRDAKEQSRLIKSAILSTPVVNPPTSFPPLSANTEKNTEQLDRPPSPGKRRIKDPYAADSLFDLLSPGKDRNESLPTPRAPATAQPPPRDLGDLFVSHDDSPDVSPSRKPIAPRAGAEKHFQPSRIFSDNDDAPDGTPSGKSVAPKAGASKNYLPSRIFGEDEDTPDAASPGKSVAPKAGAGKNYLPSRIFDDDETVAAEGNQKPVYRAHPNRYSHFEFGTDTSPREPKPIPARPKSQHMAQWNFEDFVTPEKPARKPRGQEVRHFGWSDDEGDVETPPPRPKVPQPRRDAESHIQLTDEIDTQKDARMISSYGNKGLSLYKNPLYNDEDEAENETDNNNNNKAPLSVVANGVNRKKDFDSHWSMADPTPDADANIENKKPVTSDRMKAIKMMEPSWDTYDESPQSDKVAPPPRRAARSAIDRSWDLGDM